MSNPTTWQIDDGLLRWDTWEGRTYSGAPVSSGGIPLASIAQWNASRVRNVVIVETLGGATEGFWLDPDADDGRWSVETFHRIMSIAVRERAKAE